MRRSGIMVFALMAAVALFLLSVPGGLASAVPPGGSGSHTAYYEALGDRMTVMRFDLEDADFVGLASRMNLQLAKASMALSASAYIEGAAGTALESLGFYDVQKADYRDATAADNDFVAVTFAHRDMLVDGEAQDLFAVIVRGTPGDYEWLSNFNIGLGEVHAGFQMAESGVLSAFRAYYGSLERSGHIDGDRANNKIWITGHSRGAAVANLLAADIGENLTYAPEDAVYAYTFACPNVTTHPILPDDNPYIFNFNNSADFVGCVPLESWGYRRYGSTVLVDEVPYAAEIMADEFETLTGASYDGATTESNQELIDLIESEAQSVQSYYAVSPSMSGGLFFNIRIESPALYFNGLATFMAHHRVIGVAKALNQAVGNGHFALITGHFIADNMLSSHIKHAHCVDAYLAWMDALLSIGVENLAGEAEGDEMEFVPEAEGPDVVNHTIRYTTDYVSVDIAYPEISGLQDANLESRVNTEILNVVKNAEESTVQEAEIEPDEPYYVEIDYTVERNDGVLFSVLLDVYIEDGGAHGGEAPLCWTILDQGEGAELQIGDLFNPGSDYVNVLNGKIEDLIARDEDLSDDCEFTSISAEQCFYLTDGELVVLFAESEITSYAMGMTEFRIPLSELPDILTIPF